MKAVCNYYFNDFLRISMKNQVNFGYQNLFLKISLEKRGCLIIRVVLYSGQCISYVPLH